MNSQGPSTSFSSPSSDNVNEDNGTQSSPFTTGFDSAGSQTHRHGSLAAHYYHTRGVMSAPVTGALPSTSADKAAQRQRIIDHVNAFLRRYEIAKVVTDVQQCTSSLFVLLYQRFFDCTIDGIERSPNTLEKKRRNVQLVLEQLAKQGYDVLRIDADEVVRLNEDHISLLVMVFVRIAEDMQLQEELGYIARSSGAIVAPATGHPSGYAPYGGEEGLGYTVAEVAPWRTGGALFEDLRGSGEHHHHHPYPHDDVVGAYPHLRLDERGYPHEGHHHAGGHDAQHYQLPQSSHPHAGASTGSFHDDVNVDEEENRSGVGSYIADMSAIPTDKLVEEWYRDLETPALGEGSLNLSYPSTELRSTPDSRAGGGDGGAGAKRAGRHGPHTGAERRTVHRQGGRADALDTSDIRQRHRLLNETLDRLDARRAPPSPQGRPSPPAAAAPRSAATTPLSSYHSDIGHHGRTRHPAQAPAPGGAHPRHHTLRLPVEEPPLTRAESRLLASHPYRQIDMDYRDRKIERLRAARFLANTQELIRQRMRHQHDATMAEMRNHMKSTIASGKRERLDRMRQIRDENERYRSAYETLMASAANDVRVPRYMMSRHTADLAAYFANSLHESHRVCEYLEAERSRRNREDVLRYAESVTAWQRQAYV